MLNTNRWRDAITHEQATDGGAGTGNDGANSGNAGEMSAEQLKAELERIRGALKLANSESAARRKKLDEIEAAETKRKEQDLTEAQKVAKRAEEAEAKAKDLEQRYRTTTIRHAVEIAAVKLEFADPSDAYLLADLTGVELDDAGKVQGVDKVLKALAAAKPHLIKRQQAGDINAQNRGGAQAPTVDELVQRKRASGEYMPL